MTDIQDAVLFSKQAFSVGLDNEGASVHFYFSNRIASIFFPSKKRTDARFEFI